MSKAAEDLDQVRRRQSLPLKSPVGQLLVLAKAVLVELWPQNLFGVSSKEN